jgi:hypothetical protein
MWPFKNYLIKSNIQKEAWYNLFSIFMESEKFLSTSLLLKDLKVREKCIFMVCGRGFGLKCSECLAGPGNTGGAANLF